MAKKVKFITPPGVAVYPWLTKADAKFGDPKFKVKLRLDPKDVAKVTAQVKELAKEGRYKVKTPQLPITETEDGTLLSFSSKFMPTIMDAKNNKIVDKFNLPSPERLKDIRVGGGSIIRVSAEPYYYDKGMSFQLAAVQVIKLEKGEGTSDFDEVEGYDAFSEAEAEGFGDTDEGEEADEQDYDL